MNPAVSGTPASAASRTVRARASSGLVFPRPLKSVIFSPSRWMRTWARMKKTPSVMMQIGGEVEGDDLGGAEGVGGFRCSGGEREQQESGVGDGGVGEQALEVGLRDGGEVSEEQRGDGEDEQEFDDRAAGEFAGEEGLEETDHQDETGGLGTDG